MWTSFLCLYNKCYYYYIIIIYFKLQLFEDTSLKGIHEFILIFLVAHLLFCRTPRRVQITLGYSLECQAIFCLSLPTPIHLLLKTVYLLKTHSYSRPLKFAVCSALYSPNPQFSKLVLWTQNYPDIKGQQRHYKKNSIDHYSW